MTVDHYADTAPGWASGAALVYRPLARELVRRSPHPLTGRRVLDAGAGTGLGSAALAEAGALPVAMDLSAAMLRWDRPTRPPAIVADVTRLPLADACVDDVFAAFVLNHLPRPADGLAELRRVTVPGGAVLASVYANETDNGVRDVVDQVAERHGFTPPDWYRELREERAPQVGTAATMRAAAAAAGLAVVSVEELPVDVGVHSPEDLVTYRYSQAQYSGWFAALPAQRRAEIRDDAVATVAPVMRPFRPRVVMLTATAPHPGS